MLKFPSAVPAALREPVEAERMRTLNGRGAKSGPAGGHAARVEALAKSGFLRLAQEPEDARLTGVTRSLHRRLLALNLQGSLRQPA